MLKGLTNTFKNGCNNVEVEYKEYIKLENNIIPVKAELQDDSYENGNFVGTFIFKQIIFETDATYEFRNKEFEYYKVVNGESIKIGTFISTDITINDTTEIVRVVGMDYGLKTQVEYTSTLDYESGEITLKDVWNECCQLSGLESGIDDFPNSDFIVDSDQFSGTGATIRDVFKGIAMSSGTFVKVMNDDKIYLLFNEHTNELKEVEIDESETIEDGYEIDSLELQGDTQQDGTPTPDNPVPVNVVSGGQEIDVCGSNIIGLDTQQYKVNLNAGDKITMKNQGTRALQLNLYTNYGDTTRNDYWSLQAGATRTITVARDTKAVAWNVEPNGLAWANKGETSLPYEEYIGQSYEINLGKNLFNCYTYPSNNKSNGITITNNGDGSFTLNGTATADAAFMLGTANSIKDYCTTQNMTHTAYYVSGSIQKVSSSARRTVIRLNYNIASSMISLSTLNSTHTKESKTQTQTTTSGWAWQIILGAGDICNNFTIKYQLEKGSTSTNWVAYKTPIELCKINDYQDFIRKGTGKNLFDKDNVLENKIIASDGEIIDQTGYIVGDYIKVEPNTKYAISYTRLSGVDGMRVGQYKSDKTFISRIYSTNNPYIITTPNDCEYIRITYGTQMIGNVQVEKGENASSFEPYGYKDKWYLYKTIGKVVLNGSENWGQYGGNINGFLIYGNSSSPFYNKVGNYGGYCNYFVVENSYTTWTGTGKCGFNSASVFWLIHTNTSINTTDKFKTWLQAHNISVYYILATPTTTEITDTELISQLESIELLEGINNISIISSDLTGKLKLFYYNNNFDIIEDYVELEDKRDTHPWTCLRLGMSNIEGENVDYIDQELVEQYGENWLILNDNPFAYNQEKRQQLIVAIFNQIKEFGYSSFVSKVAFKPYLTSGDIIQFRNRDKELVKSIILRYTHDGEEITLEAPSETSATVNYIYPLNAIDIAKQAQIIVEKDSVRINSLTSQTQTMQDDLRQNYYTLEQTNQLVQTASTGLTNTFSEAGGNNIFRNTGLWFATSDSNNPYEFWNGVVVKQKEEKASNMSAMLLQNGNVSQEQLVPNGKYTISFKYNKPVLLATAKIYINDTEYVLNETNDTEFTEVIEVSSQHINIRFNCDVNNGCEIYDLMVNAGEVKLAYSQNQNETTTDTVNISKGITITSSDIDVKFKADADGIRTLDNNNNEITKFTDTGMKTKEAIIESKSQIVGTLWQEVGNQTWITRL